MIGTMVPDIPDEWFPKSAQVVEKSPKSSSSNHGNNNLLKYDRITFGKMFKNDVKEEKASG